MKKKKIIDTIIEAGTKQIVSSILVLLSPTVVAVLFAFRKQIDEHILPSLSKQELLGIAAGSISLLLLAMAWVVYLRKKIKTCAAKMAEMAKQIANRLILRFGILWSRDLAPYCPACSGPLGAYRHWPSERDGGFPCAKCEQFMELRDDEGKMITLVAAREALSKMDLWRPRTE